jgi:hypothetical protein
MIYTPESPIKGWRFWTVYVFDSSVVYPLGLFSPYYHERWPAREPLVARHIRCSGGWCHCGIWIFRSQRAVRALARRYALEKNVPVCYGPATVWGRVKEAPEGWAGEAGYPASAITLAVPPRYRQRAKEFCDSLSRQYGIEVRPGKPLPELPL